jgi:hypothetical protein
MLQLKRRRSTSRTPRLVPKAGDCIKCPKRTGNQADLFGDVKSADVCTDPKCFDDKRHAHMAAEAEGARGEGQEGDLRRRRPRRSSRTGTNGSDRATA